MRNKYCNCIEQVTHQQKYNLPTQLTSDRQARIGLSLKSSVHFLIKQMLNWVNNERKIINTVFYTMMFHSIRKKNSLLGIFFYNYGFFFCRISSGKYCFCNKLLIYYIYIIYMFLKKRTPLR